MDDTIILDGKKYISARRASEISGYNSDYLGQLCRGEKLQSKLISRTWFVLEDSLIEHQKLSGRKKKNTEVLSSDVGSEEFFNENQKIKFNALKKNLFGRDSLDHTKFQLGLKNFFSVLFVSLSVIVLIFFSKTTTLQNSVETISFQLTNTIQKDVNSEDGLASLKNESYWQGLSRTMRKLKDLAFNPLKKIFNKNYFAVDYIAPEFEYKDEKGIVTLPLPEDANTVTEIKNYLANSFSDEVRIVPDETGVAGVIKPVFTEIDGDEYLYVMVPIK